MSALSAEEHASFTRDGFLIKERFFSAEEIDTLSAVSRSLAQRDGALGRGGTADKDGRQSEFWMIGRTRIGTDRDIFNAVCYGQRMVDAMSTLLDDS